MVFTFKGQLDAFSEKLFKTFVTNNLKNALNKLDYSEFSSIIISSVASLVAADPSVSSDSSEDSSTIWFIYRDSSSSISFVSVWMLSGLFFLESIILGYTDNPTKQEKIKIKNFFYY